MEYRQHFFVEGQYKGSTLRPKIPVHEVYVPPCGVAFFCPFCARVWALCPVEGQVTRVMSQLCGKHTKGEQLGGWETPGFYHEPGSMYVGFEKNWIDYWPEDMIKYEFELIVKQTS